VLEGTPNNLVTDLADNATFSNGSHAQSSGAEASAHKTSILDGPQTEPSRTNQFWPRWVSIAGLLGVLAVLFAWWWQTLDSTDRFLAGWTIVIASLANIPSA